MEDRARAFSATEAIEGPPDNCRPTSRLPEQSIAGVREQLRTATYAIHQELHSLAVFQEILAGSLQLAGYVALLGRLWGFHASFEARLGLSPRRSDRLVVDLAALGIAPDVVASLQRWIPVASLETPAQRLGARYVIEGSALGGQVIARALNPILGAKCVEGRRFFLGEGEATGARWQTFLAELDAGLERPECRLAAIASAEATFVAFGQWLKGGMQRT